MDLSNFAAVYRSSLRAAMNAIADTICTSQLSIEDYRKNQGIIEGLALAERELLDLMKTASQEDAADLDS